MPTPSARLRTKYSRGEAKARARSAICGALLGADPLGMRERHRMHADMFVDDELHARQADAGVGRHRRAERQVGIAEVRHDLASSA